jgi:hypothetical protein
MKDFATQAVVNVKIARCGGGTVFSNSLSCRLEFGFFDEEDRIVGKIFVEDFDTLYQIQLVISCRNQQTLR